MVVTKPLLDLLSTSMSTLFMVVCGGMVLHTESSADLIELKGVSSNLIIKKYKFIPWCLSFSIKHVFAFTVKGLIPSLVVNMVIDMAHRAII